MILYHFTWVEYLDSIKRDGLNRGDVPTKLRGPLFETNAVWFTTEPQPEGHGLGEFKILTEEDRKLHFEVFGVLPPEGAVFFDKKGNSHKTWWLYFGTVAPDQFRAVDHLNG